MHPQPGKRVGEAHIARNAALAAQVAVTMAGPGTLAA